MFVPVHFALLDSYILTADSWRYLATTTVLQSRHIVGWALADQMRANPCHKTWIESFLGTL